MTYSAVSEEEGLCFWLLDHMPLTRTEPRGTPPFSASSIEPGKEKVGAKSVEMIGQSHEV